MFQYFNYNNLLLKTILINLIKCIKFSIKSNDSKKIFEAFSIQERAKIYRIFSILTKIAYGQLRFIVAT